MKLREQCGINSYTGLVVLPERISERLNYVICGDTHVCGAVFHHLQDGPKDPGDGTEWWVWLFRAPQTIEVAKQLVCPIQEMNDHGQVSLQCIDDGIREHDADAGGT
jgi:hypothetical protein